MDARHEYLSEIRIRELKAELNKAEEERDALAAQCQEVMPLARCALHIAWARNDHNSPHPQELARQTAGDVGINNPQQANEFLDAAQRGDFLMPGGWDERR